MPAQNTQEIKSSLQRVSQLMKNDPDQARKLLDETIQKMGEGEQQQQDQR
jgi:hypothetical protein